ncbi:MAG: hypothetical protein ACFFDK_07760 [Promethearchaeota archaeon]
MANFFGNLSLTGFMDGITATGIIISCVIVGLFSFYKAKKLEAKLLSVAGLNMIFVGCLWLGPASDFFHMIITGKNINPLYIYGWLSYIWILPAVVTGYYIGGELMMPSKKKIVVGIYAIIGIIFTLLMFLSPMSAANVGGIRFEPVFLIDQPTGGDLIDATFNRASLAYWIILFFQFSIIIFLALGYAIKAKQTSGDLRKRFIYLCVGSLIFFTCGLFDSTFPPGPYLAVWRGLMMTYSLWFYFGLKT